MHVVRRTRLSVGWPVLLALTGVACGTRSQPREVGGRMPDLDSLPRLSATSIQRFGSEQSPDTGFTRVGDVHVDRDGLVYAVDRLDCRIRVYDPTAHLVRFIGRRGRGPGEFESPPLFGIVGDTVWTYDRRSRRLTLFDRNGRVISNARVARIEVPVPDVTSMKGILDPVLMRPDGRLLSSVGGYIGGGPPKQDVLDTLQNPEVEWDASGRVLDTVAWYPAPYVGGNAGYITIEGQIFGIPLPPSDRPSRLLLAEGQIVVDRSTATSAGVDSLSVTRTSFSGDTVYHRAFRYTPVGYSPDVLDSIAWRHSSPAISPGGAPAKRSPVAERTVRASMRFPAYQPPVQDALVGASGGVWLRREDRGEATYDWVVIDPDGRARGVVRLPRAVRPAWARDDRVLTVSTDSAGVPWLVELQLGGDP